MKNKEWIQKRVEQYDCRLGCYANAIDKLPKEQLLKILNNIEFADTDVKVSIGENKYIIEIVRTDNEVDFYMLSENEFTEKYGWVYE